MVELQVKLEGVPQMQKALEKASVEVKKKIDEAIQRGAIAIENQTVDNIVKGGVPFIPLKPFTLLEKARLGYSLTPLNRQGFMRQSVRSAKTGEMQAEVTAGGAFAPYYIVHEFGAPTVGIPARPTIQPAIDLIAPRISEDLKKVLE